MIHVGINVNWAMWRWEIRAFSDKTVEAFRRVGFDHVRIRFRGDYEKLGMDRETYFRHIDRIIDASLQHGLVPILAFGAEAFKRNPDRKHFREAVGIWRYVAKRYQGMSHRLAFDLMIEPAKQIKREPEILNTFYVRALRAIRQTNPDRIVFIAPPKLAHPESLELLKIPKEGNGYLMIETHFYAAGPSPSHPKKRWTTGTASEKAIFERELQMALRWQHEHGIEIWMGAVMPGDYNHGDHYTIEAQEHFARFFSCLFRRYGVPFAINADQQFYDPRRGMWRKDRWPVLQAILQPDCS
jgi:hypothetical protein